MDMSRGSVLIIDGSPEAALLRAALEDSGLVVFALADAANGGLIFRNQRPDLTVVGVRDRHAAGWRTLTDLRRHDPSAKLAVWTDAASDESRRQAATHACVAHFAKDGDVKGTAAALARLVENLRPDAPPLRGRVLVVDDEAVVRDVLRRFLEGKGVAVATAAGGEEALRLVKKERPHLMLLDLRMPGLGGLDVLKAARALDKEIAVMMVTAENDVAVARQSMELGACDYIVKPFDLRYLEITVMAKLFLVTS